MELRSLPPPNDPRPRWQPLELEVGGQRVRVRNDGYSDRIRCDHPEATDGKALGHALIEAARKERRGRVVALVPGQLREGLEAAGLQWEATMPGFYGGNVDCAVLGLALDEKRATSHDIEAVENVDRIVRESPPPRPRSLPPTVRAKPEDAGPIAELINSCFAHYPTPSGVPSYVATQIREGIPFRFVRREPANAETPPGLGLANAPLEVVACASADLVPQAKTAELTDCSTRPDQRGGGFMQAILASLMDDLRSMGYPTAFTLARASIPGVNLAFLRLGFEFQGRMIQSCRIGDGMEDMNVWSRRL